jgi:acylphosphatase
MKTAVIHVTGNVQKVGYRTKIVAFAEYLGIKGYIKNLPDKSVEIAAQGNTDTLETFIQGLKIQDKLIKVENVEVEYFDAPQDYTDFDKIVGHNETDARLDDGITILKEISDTLKKNHIELVNKMDETNHCIQEGFTKMDHNHAELVNKMDETNYCIQEGFTKMDHNHVELVREIHGLREDNSERVMNEIQEVKALLKLHLKQS